MSTGCNQFKHAPGCGHPGRGGGGPAEAAVTLGPDFEVTDVPVSDLRIGMVVDLDGDRCTVTSTDGDHKSISIEFDHDPNTIASYGLDETLPRVGAPDYYETVDATRDYGLDRDGYDHDDGILDYDDANPLYPNGRCDACGFGLDEGRACYNSDCSDFDADSPYAYHDVATTFYDDPADPGLWQSQAAADMADLADGEKHLFVSADGATRVVVTCERAQAFNEFGYAVPGATRGAYRVRPVDAPEHTSVEFPFDNMNGNESQGTWSAAGLVREMLKPTE